MNQPDEAELHRLCEHLDQIDRDFSLSDAQQEALKKAALALQRAFIGGLRQTVEDWFASIGQPLSEEERLLLRPRTL